MPFYVPVGPRGPLLRVGMMLLAVMGAIRYWRDARRRLAALPLVFDPLEA